MIDRGYYDKILNEIEVSKLDIKKRELKNGKEKITILFIEQLTDKSMLTNDIIKPINIYITKNGSEIMAQEVLDSIIYGPDCSIDDKEEKIIEYILNGMTIIIFSNEKEYIVVNLKNVEKRAIDNPELTFTLRGPRDSFVENLDVNLSLVRYRIKDPKLNINRLQVGRRTKTAIAILHISDVANDSVVEDITNRIKNIDVDGVISSGEIQRLILNKRFNFFPQMGVVERSDMAAGALLEGKVLVLAEGSVLALVAPKVFSEFFTSGDDFYDDKFIAILAKYVRMYSTFLSVTITALYVAILSFHIDTLPGDFIFAIFDADQGVPFSVLVGALIVEMIIEMLREALLRIPKQIGSAVGVVGGIIIGQAAIAAKIFSPLLLIVVAVSLLSSFTAPDYTIMNPLRIIKFLLIIASGLFGLIGFTLALSIVLINMVSVSTFGIPYLEPFAPFNWYDFKNTFFYGKDISPLRPNFLKTKDRTRSNPRKK
jgi:spore germination protein KA